jgi:hypothetical protein
MHEMGRTDPALGHLKHLIPNHDNRAYFCIYETGEADSEREYAFAFMGKVAARHKAMACEHWALSYDGKKLVVTSQGRRNGKPESQIFINGELAYTVPHDVIYHMAWLDNDRLVCECWDDDDISLPTPGLWYYINGEEMVGFSFDECRTTEGRQILRVREGDRVFTIDDTGAHSEPEEAIFDENGRFSFSFHETSRWWRSEEREKSYEIARTGKRPDPLPPDADARGMKLSDLNLYGLLDDHDGQQVTWRGEAGPKFDEIENGGGIRKYAFNADMMRIAYIGINYAGWARLMTEKVVVPLFLRAEEREDTEGKPPWWSWPLVMLFNPTMGVGYAVSESTRRWIPVDNGRAWKKRYEYAHHHFYTPSDNLVVTCYRGNKVMVVVDEDEGPAFDQVWNVRYDHGCVSYLARLGDKILRVYFE